MNAVSGFALFCVIWGTWIRKGFADGTNFVYHTSSLNWNEANAKCLEAGMTLATPEETSNSAITHFFNTNDENDVTDDIWIGVYASNTANAEFSSAANCGALTGQWTNWDEGEPSNDDSYLCVGLVKTEYDWKSFPCNEAKPFLCFRSEDQCSGAGCTFSTVHTDYTSSGDEIDPHCTLTTTKAPLTTQGQTTVQPTTQGQTTVQPTTQGQTTVQPTTQGQTTVQPTTQGQTTVQPTTQSQTTVQPTTQGQTTVQATTQGQTTVQPTTQSQTTVQPTTQGQTTVQATTQGQTTVQATTQGQTTVQPTTQGHTTVQPTTQGQTTVQANTQGDTTTQTTTEVEATTRRSTDTEQITEASTGGDATAQTTTSAEATTRPVAPTVVTEPGSSATTTAGTSGHFCCACESSTSSQRPEHPTENLLLDKSKLSSTRRRKESATDNRMSCAAIGIASVLLVFSVYAFIVLTDIFRIYRDLRFGVLYKRKRKD